MKYFMKLLLFLTIFVVLLFGSSYIFLPKNNDKLHGMDQVSVHGILGEKENVVDVLVVGDSETYHAITPMEIYEKYGITAYVCGSPAQVLNESYKHFSDTLKRQKIKTLIIETNALYRKHTIWNDFYTKVKDVFPIVKYHNRWKNLRFDDFYSSISRDNREVNKGYKFNYLVNASNRKNYMKKNDIAKDIPDLNVKFLKKMVDLANKNDIEVILLSTPSSANWNYNKHNGVAKLAKKFKVEYVDLNLVPEIGIDWSKDTRDKGDHLNYYGATKVTNYLADYLNELGYLEDHRKDSYYKEWNEDLVKYKNSLLSGN